MQRMHPGYQGGWVVLDILPDSIKRLSERMMCSIIALPDGFSEVFGHGGLEGADHNVNGSGMPDPYILRDENPMEVVRDDHKSI
jgi:hypothetical protein